MKTYSVFDLETRPKNAGNPRPRGPISSLCAALRRFGRGGEGRFAVLRGWGTGMCLVDFKAFLMGKWGNP